MYSTPPEDFMCSSGVSTQTTRSWLSASGRVANPLSLERREVPVLGSRKVKISEEAARVVSLGYATSTP